MNVPEEWVQTMGPDPVNDWMNVEWLELTPERVVGRAVVGAAHHQPMGLVHGGIWCALVETMASVGGALRAHELDMHVVGVNNSTDFIRALSEGAVTCVGEPIHVGRSQQLWGVEITRDADGKLVARGQVRLHNVARDFGR